MGCHQLGSVVLLPSCRCVAFGNSYNDEERCVLAGYDNGDVKMFDLRMNKVCPWQFTLDADIKETAGGVGIAVENRTRQG
jgi:hypothetical protein